MPKTILAVDDEKAIVRLVQVNLERCGYKVLTAFDGKAALEMIAQHRPDLVVMDVMMPHLDGFEALRQLRLDPHTRDLPVIMLTAKAMDSDLYEGYRRGADCYLTKPFNPNELIAFVRRILEYPGSDGEKRFQL